MKKSSEKLFKKCAIGILAAILCIAGTLITVSPSAVQAQTTNSTYNSIFGVLTPPPLVVCGSASSATTNHPCTFADLFTLGVNIIHFIFYLSVPCAVAGFSYAGWLYLTAGDNPGQTEKARDIFKSVAIGFFWICAAWLVVYTIGHTLLSSSYTLFQIQ